MKNNANFAIIFVGSVFIFLGSFLAVMGFNLIKTNARFNAEAVSVEGVIVDIGVERYRSGNETRTRRILSVDYVVNGVKYENTVSFQSGVSIGDEITLYYIPGEHWNVKTGSKGDTAVGPFFIGVGGFFFIMGLFFLNNVRRKGALKKYLKQHGKTVYAQVIAAEKDYSVSVSYGGASTHPYYYIKCAVMEPVTGEIKGTYKSWSIKNDNLEIYIGKQVKVYLHPQDDRKYYVDLEGLTGN
ncbi:MAG: DUF3592 domain-containing protein [Treponema sp.]|nr:DUF3592 domain-containing protein [Treponema sp.]